MSVWLDCELVHMEPGNPQAMAEAILKVVDAEQRLRVAARCAASQHTVHTVLSKMGCSICRWVRDGNRYIFGLRQRQ
jgi:hypothetical protein